MLCMSFSLGNVSQGIAGDSIRQIRDSNLIAGFKTDCHRGETFCGGLHLVAVLHHGLTEGIIVVTIDQRDQFVQIERIS